MPNPANLIKKNPYLLICKWCGNRFVSFIVDKKKKQKL